MMIFRTIFRQCNKSMIKESSADAFIHSFMLQGNTFFQYLISSDLFRFNYLIPIKKKGTYLHEDLCHRKLHFRSPREIQSHPRLNFANLFFRLPRFHYSTIWRVAQITNGLFNTDYARRRKLGYGTYLKKIFSRNPRTESRDIKH